MNRRKFLKLLPTSAGTAIVASKVSTAEIIPNPKPWCEEDDISDFIKVANNAIGANNRFRGERNKLLNKAIERNEVI